MSHSLQHILRATSALAFVATLGTASLAQEAPAPAAPQTVQSGEPFLIRTIQVQGNQRVEANTVASYLLFAPGDPYTDERVDLSLKTLYATGLFADVQIEPREGGNVLITVVENPIINRVIFEGNKALKTDKITDEIEAEPRSIFSRASVQADVQRIVELYRQSGRFGAIVEPKVVQQPQNRVDLVFEITEGPKTGVKRINFIGNNEFSDKRLRDEIATAESRWFKIFESNDNYDPGRLEFDREQLRTFYTDRGFADFRVVAAVAELTPDQEDFFITFTIDEGEEYRWGDISVESDIEDLDQDFLENLIEIDDGDLYRASDVETAIDALNFAAGTSGYAFVDIQPDVRFNRETKTADLVFRVIEGPRVYIERIDIVGNTTTLDYVVRREMELVEGDAFNRVLLDRSRRRIRGLRFFEEVEIEETEGSTPDRAIVQVKVKEQPTGELAFSAGFSAADRFLVDLTIVERNLRGRGQTAQFVIRASSRRREIDLRFTEPRFLGRNLAAGIELFDITFDLTEFGSFRQQRRGGQVSLGFPLTEDSRFLARYALREDDIEIPGVNCDVELANPASQFATTCLSEGGRLSSILGYSFFWDKTNDPIEPTGGFNFSLTQDFAGVGGDVQYLRSEARLAAYQGIINDVVASARFQGGYITGWGGEPVQLGDRFFKGTNDFRGYDNLGIGPRVLVRNDATGEIRRERALGGNAFALATAEVSFPTPVPQVDAALFVEAGTVGLIDEEFEFETPLNNGFTRFTEDSLAVRAMLGASFFWESPFGPLRFDFTQPLRQFDFDERQSFSFTQRTRF